MSRVVRFALGMALGVLGCVYTAHAQTTTTGTIVDPNGNPYFPGTESAIVVVASGQPTSPPLSTTMNSVGFFTLSLPAGTYIFTTCGQPIELPPANPVANLTPRQICFQSAPIVISGGSQDISTTLNAIASSLGPPGASGTFPGNAATATALKNVPTQCGSNNFSTGIASSGNASCSQVGAFSSDAIQYVSTSGNDGNDGLKLGSPKLTPQAAHNALPASGGMIFLLAGVFSSSGTTLAISKSNVIVQCIGLDATTIRSSSASLPTITVGSSLTAVQIKDCTVDHSPAAGLNSGAHGISFPSTVSACTIERVRVQFNDIGILLGPADIAWLRQSIIQKNANDGVRVTFTSGAPMQWQLDTVLSQENGGHGYNVLAVGTGGISLGNWHAVSTFGNSGHGISLSGLAANAINGFRLSDGFLGGDGNDEIFLDTFGGEHIITGTFVEQAGTGATGPTLATAASHIGHGLSLTVNNTDVSITGGYSQGNSYSGLASSATHLTISNFDAMENGQSGTSGAAFQSGIVILAATSVSVTGGKLTNRTGTTQKYGLYTQADAVTMTGTRVDGNATAPIGSSLSLTQSRFITGNVSDIMANSNIVPGANFGSTGATSGTTGTKDHFLFAITAGGTGIAANPTAVVTFPVTLPTAPFFQCEQSGGPDVFTGIVGQNAASTTTMTLTFIGTPVTGHINSFICSNTP